MTLEDRTSSVNAQALTREELSEEAVLARDSNEYDAVKMLVRDTAKDVTAKHIVSRRGLFAPTQSEEDASLKTF